MAHGKGHNHIISTHVQNMVCPLAARSSHTFALVSTSVATWLKQFVPANKFSSLHSGVSIVATEHIVELSHRSQAAEHSAPRVFNATDNGAADNASERLPALAPVVQRTQLSKGSTQTWNASLRTPQKGHAPSRTSDRKENDAMRVFTDDAFEDQLDEGQINATNQDLCTALAKVNPGRPRLSVRCCWQGDGFESSFGMFLGRRNL